MNPDEKKRFTRMDDQIKANCADAAMSLAQAMQECGGRVSTDLMNMTLSEFIATVAGPNDIRFVCIKPDDKKA